MNAGWILLVLLASYALWKFVYYFWVPSTDLAHDERAVEVGIVEPLERADDPRHLAVIRLSIWLIMYTVIKMLLLLVACHEAYIAISSEPHPVSIFVAPAIPLLAAWLYGISRICASGKGGLVRHGIYRHVRMPEQTVDLLFWFAFIVCSQSVSFTIALLAYLTTLLFCLPRMDAMRATMYGSAYVEYARRTGLLLPRIGRIHSH